MIWAILGLTISGGLYSIYYKWSQKQALLSDIALKKEQDKIDSLKAEISKTQEALDASANDYNSVYNAYTRKYGPKPGNDGNK